MSESIILVSSSAELLEALKTCTGGETIKLAAGTYDPLTMYKGNTKVDFASTVTITSADPDNPAVLTGLKVTDASELTFDGLVFDYTYQAGDALSARAFAAYTSTNIAFKNSLFTGDVASGHSETADGYASGRGLTITGSTGVTVENNEISGFYIGLTIGTSDDITVSGNNIHSLRMDGMNIFDVQGIVIEDNYIHDFIGSVTAGDHCDMIQFWSTNTTRPSTDIIIRGNILDIGNGTYTQSIFMRNEAVDNQGGGSDMYYQNILIENNTIYNAHLHGITVGEANGVVISNNTLIQALGSDPRLDNSAEAVRRPGIKVAATSSDVTITDNILDGRIRDADGEDWIVTGNLFIQNQNSSGAGYYTEIFVVSSLTQGASGGHSYILKDIYTGLGSVAVQPDTDTHTVSARFDVFSNMSSRSDLLFDASVSLGVDGAALPEGTLYLWTFADGTTATGPLVAHHFAPRGLHSVSLRIELPDGTVANASAVLNNAPENIVTFDASTGLMALGPEETRKFVDKNGVVVAATPDAGRGTGEETAQTGIELAATGQSAKINRADLASIFSSDNMQIDMTLKAAATGAAAGEIFRLHTAFTAVIETNGALKFTLTTEDGTTSTLRSSGMSFLDGQAHSLSIIYDGMAGSVILIVDDIAMGMVSAGSKLAPVASWNMTFGNPWGQKNFVGTITDFAITKENGRYDLTDVTAPADTNGAMSMTGSTTQDSPPEITDEDQFIFNTSDDLSGEDSPDADDTGATPPAAAPASPVPEDDPYILENGFSPTQDDFVLIS